MPAAMHSFYLRTCITRTGLPFLEGSVLLELRSTSHESRHLPSYCRRGRTILHRGSRSMLRPNYTKGQLSSCSPILDTSLASLAHLAVSMAIDKTQTSRRVRLNG